MKNKLFFLIVFLLIIGFLAFGDDEEEIGFLLFLPNSSSQFANESQAKAQLDNLAKYFINRDGSGKINIYGYAAVAPNDIDPKVLSKDRALFIVNELQKRGVPKDWFSEPVGLGEVDLWGSNRNEESRQPNRRVRVVQDGFFITVAAGSGEVIESEVPPVVELKAAEPESEIFKETPIKSDDFKEPKKSIPWWLLLPLLLLLIPFFLSKRKKSDKPSKPAPAPAPVVAAAAPAEAVMPIAVMSTETGESVVYLEEEIRRRAYEYAEMRNFENGTMDGDWYKALPEICAKYEAAGYRTYSDGSWWAQKTFSKKV